MVNYNPNLIEAFAEALYKQAEAITRRYSIWGFVLLFFPALLYMWSTGLSVYLSPLLGVLLYVGVAMVLGVLGAWTGHEAAKGKVFKLKLDAQTALCQMRIERNTRPEIDRTPATDTHAGRREPTIGTG